MGKCKVIALYLPQFHEVEENNKWWSKGFTEWTHVKNAKPLFTGHVQPRIPLNGYYNLLNKDTVIKQTSDLNNYGIYGFAYYHYWFKGRLLLEKPIENLRKWTDINQKYMFIWANHDWFKSTDGKKELLIRQTYGEEDDWKKHYDYFYPFFCDERYIKIDNKPVLGIYMPNNIVHFNNMIAYWNERAIHDGFDGIYLINGCNHSKEIDYFEKLNQHYVIREPNIAFEAIRKKQKIITQLFIFINNRFLRIPWLREYQYDDVSYYERSACEKGGDNCFYSLCSGWDNTPRHGNRGEIIIGLTPSKFKDTFRYIYTQSMINRKEFLFVNAWNEWAEGMYLEPDTINGYQYLDAIKSVIESYTGVN